MPPVTCEELHPDDWARLRDIRLESLRESPYAFGGTYEAEKLFTEENWRASFEKLAYITAAVNGTDAAIMSVEVLDGDFGATCWIGGCWSNPEFRGKGLMRAMFADLDLHAQARGWQVQGLGVWTDNSSAIAAYESLGFVSMGEPQPSSRQQNKFYQRMIRKTFEG